MDGVVNRALDGFANRAMGWMTDYPPSFNHNPAVHTLCRVFVHPPHLLLQLLGNRPARKARERVHTTQVVGEWIPVEVLVVIDGVAIGGG